MLYLLSYLGIGVRWRVELLRKGHNLTCSRNYLNMEARLPVSFWLTKLEYALTPVYVFMAKVEGIEPPRQGFGDQPVTMTVTDLLSFIRVISTTLFRLAFAFTYFNHLNTPLIYLLKRNALLILLFY